MIHFQFSLTVSPNKSYGEYSHCVHMCYKCPLLQISTISADFQSLYYIFSKQMLFLLLASVKKDIGSVPLLFVLLNGGKGVISDSGQRE